jgi:hypothetical protein
MRRAEIVKKVGWDVWEGISGKPEVGRPVVRPSCSCESNVEINPKGTGREQVEEIALAQDRDK